MRRGRIGGVLTALAAALVLSVPVAGAATPQQIYRDYADNGRLDSAYSSSDLQRAYQDALVQGYGQPSVVSGLGEQAQGAVETRAGLPFTGLDLTLMVVSGVALLLFGVGLRRAARQKT